MSMSDEVDRVRRVLQRECCEHRSQLKDDPAPCVDCERIAIMIAKEQTETITDLQQDRDAQTSTRLAVQEAKNRLEVHSITLEEALRRYGQHDAGCPSAPRAATAYSPDHELGPCTCGLVDIMRDCSFIA